MDDNLVIEQLKCPVCLEFASEAYECSCNNIFCKDCITFSSKQINCPICRKPPSYKEAQFARKMIKSLPASCPNECDVKNLTIGDLKNHLPKCPMRNLKCKLCKSSFKPDDFFSHLIESHKDDIIEQYTDKEIAKETTNSTLNPFNINEKQPDTKTYKNSDGNMSSMSYNKKFYCGKKKDVNCFCCDQNCGPDNGCNCSACNLIERLHYNLPDHIFINSAGNTTILATNGFFYCNMMYQDRNASLLIKMFKKEKLIQCTCMNPCPDCMNFFRNKNVYLSKYRNN